MTDAVREYRERLLDLVVNRSDVRMDGAVQYVQEGDMTDHSPERLREMGPERMRYEDMTRRRVQGIGDDTYRAVIAEQDAIIANLRTEVDDLEGEIARLQWKLGERGLV